jgi:uncharacterized heparinase superfamily protein
MTVARLMELAKKAATRPPRQVLARIGEEARRAARRPWSGVYPAIFSDRALLSATGFASIDALWQALAAQPFFISPPQRDTVARAFRARYPDGEAAIVADAERILRHEFDLLGSGPKCFGPQLPWHEDFKTGRVWPLQYSPDIQYNELDRPTDVKVPWELSRCQHFPRLGQAYWLTDDERYAREFVDQVSDWIRRNPWGYGVNWACAMDVALRAVNWIWGFYFFAGSAACRDSAFRARLLRSLFLHGDYVITHLEKGPVNGNHYLSDAVGLIVLGCFFRGAPKARRWLETGRAIVFEEMLLQVTGDGVDFEASMAYHRLVLELFLTAYELLRLQGEQIPAPQLTRLERMIEFVEAYTKPNGHAPLIGDADDGRVQMLGRQSTNDHRYMLSSGAVIFGRSDFKARAGELWEESFWMFGPEAARRFDAIPDAPPDDTSRAFPEGGFFVLRDRRTHIVIDCGNVGMRGIGGHGHNDILSFELVLDGVSIVTDCGAYLYTASREWRNRFRGTSFHNTVQVGEEELNRFVSPDNLWQLRDDATPDAVNWRFTAARDRFTGAHLGYQRLANPVRHVRTVVLDRDRGAVLIDDELQGMGAHDITSRLHLDPAARCAIVDGDVRVAVGGDERWVLPVDGFADLRVGVEGGWVSPTYGIKHATDVVTFSGRVTMPRRVTFLFSTVHVSRDARTTYARALADF